MKWILLLLEFVKGLPAVAKLFEKFIDLKTKELPMKIDKHEERKGVREQKAKNKVEKLEDKGAKKNKRRDRKDKKEKK